MPNPLKMENPVIADPDAKIGYQALKGLKEDRLSDLDKRTIEKLSESGMKENNNSEISAIVTTASQIRVINSFIDIADEARAKIKNGNTQINPGPITITGIRSKEEKSYSLGRTLSDMRNITLAGDGDSYSQSDFRLAPRFAGVSFSNEDRQAANIENMPTVADTLHMSANEYGVLRDKLVKQFMHDTKRLEKLVTDNLLTNNPNESLHIKWVSKDSTPSPWESDYPNMAPQTAPAIAPGGMK